MKLSIVKRIELELDLENITDLPIKITDKDLSDGTINYWCDDHEFHIEIDGKVYSYEATYSNTETACESIP